MNRAPERRSGSAPSRLWGRIACGWSLAFAGLHFYWGLGGDVGLSVSAGPLATERPLWFVVAGLWGVGGLCLLGAVRARLLTRSDLRGTPATPVRWLGWGISAVLLARGIGIEVMLLTGAGDVGASVSEQQRTWTLVLWNPWFIAGGVAFGLATLHRPGKRNNLRAQRVRADAPHGVEGCREPGGGPVRFGRGTGRRSPIRH